MHSFAGKVHRANAFRIVVAMCAILVCAGTDRAQTLRARVSVLNGSSAGLKIEGEYHGGAKQWSFPNTYAGIIGLGDRIQNFSLADYAGHDLSVTKLGPGEYRAAEQATHFSYEVNASEPNNPTDAAHVSWLNGDYGYLMLADLLPNLGEGSTALIEFALPAEWTIASSIQPDSDHRYRVAEPEKAVFFIGRALRQKLKRIGAMEFTFVTSGDWVFSDDDAASVAAKVLKDQAKHVGRNLDGRSVLMLAALPGVFGAEHWSAETRGSSIVLLFGKNSSRAALLAKIGIALTHELFHLWVPNALPFDGNYDWFFEGFTLYQALRSAVRLGFIDFREYLDTMARVYNSYLATPERDRFSLIEASQRRWTSSSSLVYDKGMLVAFLCDLMLRSASDNRRSLDDVYRELFRRFPQAARRVDGNEAIVSLLIEELGSNEIAERYIKSQGGIELETLLGPNGLRVEAAGLRKRLSVKAELSKRQRELLRSLGYNRKS
jgi:predicted metalloprotease with PDZ domain